VHAHTYFSFVYSLNSAYSASQRDPGLDDFYDDEFKKIYLEVETNLWFQKHLESPPMRLTWSNAFRSSLLFDIGQFTEKSARHRYDYLRKTHVEWRDELCLYRETQRRLHLQTEQTRYLTRRLGGKSKESKQNEFAATVIQLSEGEITYSDAAKRLSTKIKSASKEALRGAVTLYEQTKKVIQYEHLVETRGRKTKLSARVEEQIKVMCVKAKDEGSFATQLMVGQWADSFYRAEYNVAPKVDGYKDWKDVEFVSRSWVSRFCKRHRGLWQTAKATSHDRKNWTTYTSLADHFNRIADTLIKLGWATLNPEFDPKTRDSERIFIKEEFKNRIWSCDETRLTMCMKGSKKKVATFSLQCNQPQPTYAMPSGGISCSAMGCRSVSGSTIPPMFVCQSKISEENKELVRKVHPEAKFLANKKASFDGDNFREWLRHFRDSLQLPRSAPVLLLYDGVRTHSVASNVLECSELNILPMLLPPHTTHLLQGEDLWTFTVLKRVLAVEKEFAQQLMNAAVRLTGLAHTRAPPVAWFWQNVADAWRIALSTENNLIGWAKQGISPFTQRPLCEHKEWIARTLHPELYEPPPESAASIRPELSPEECDAHEKKLEFAGCVGLRARLNFDDDAAKPIDGSLENMPHTLNAIVQATKMAEWAQKKISELMLDESSEAVEIKDICAIAISTQQTMLATVRKQVAGAKRARNGNGIVTAEAGVLTAPHIIAAMRDQLEDQEERQRNKRPRRSRATMLENHSAIIQEKLKNLEENGGELPKRLTKTEMYAILRYHGSRVSFLASTAECRMLLPQFHPILAQASERAWTRRNSARASGRQENDAEDVFDSSESDEDEETAANPTEVESDSDGDQPTMEDYDDFGMGCSRCRWSQNGCFTCKRWYDHGRRRIGEREWTRKPVDH